jgi:hypothetical protein
LTEKNKKISESQNIYKDTGNILSFSRG